jgi:hypothetical protein
VLLVGAAPAGAFGTFRAFHHYNTGADVYGIAVADMNRDGKPDILAGGDVTDGDPANGVSYFRGRGDGTFKQRKKITDLGGPEGIVTGDFDGDKIRDFATAEYESNSVGIYHGKKSGGFKRTQKLDDLADPWLLASADLDGNGHTDLVAGNYAGDGSNAITVFGGKANGSFKQGVDYPGGSSIYGIALERFSPDRNPDLLASDSTGEISYYNGKSGGSFGGPHPVIDFSTDPDFSGFGYGLAAGTFDKPHLDAATGVNTSSGNDYVHVDPDIGQPGLILLPEPVPSPGAPNGIASADFNLDGVDDLAIGRADDSGFNLLRSKNDIYGMPPFRFGPNDVYEGTEPADWVAAGRLNGDRAPDVIVGTDTGIDVYLNKKK